MQLPETVKNWESGEIFFNTDVSEDERDDYAGDLMLSNMKEGKSGYGLDPKRKEVSLYYYMPLKIEESGEPWYVVTCSEDSVSTSRMQVVMDAINSLMVIILVVISVSVGVYIYSWRQSKKELMSLAYQDPVTIREIILQLLRKRQKQKRWCRMADCYGCDRF